MQKRPDLSGFEFDDHLDVFGQNPRLSRLYTQLCFCFSLPDLSLQSKSAAISLLSNGLERLSASFPWTAGQVVNEAGISKIVPFEKAPCVLVKDLRDDLPTMDKFREAGFPFNMLDENVISPRIHFPSASKNLLLGQHNCMDMAGQGQIIHLFAKACRGEPFTREELRTGNLSRRDIIPLLNKQEADPERPQQDPLPTSNKKEEAPVPIPQSTWVYFLFSPTSLSTLKSLAIKTVPSGYVSTDDVLSAFLWQSVTRARLWRLSLATNSTFDRQVDVRKHLGIPQTYTGNVVFKTSNTYPVKIILESPLGVLASYLRSSLSPASEIAYKIRAEATKLRDKLSAGNTGGGAAAARSTLPSTDIKMSSWAKEKCYEFDFGGILGRAEAVRRPRFAAWEGLAYFLPKRLDGEIAVAICLRGEDLERLKADEEFGRVGKFVG